MLLETAPTPGPGPGGDINIPVDEDATSGFWTILSDMFHSQYFWPVITILVAAVIGAWVWKNYPIVRYVTFFILGVAASGYGVFAVFVK